MSSCIPSHSFGSRTAVASNCSCRRLRSAVSPTRLATLTPREANLTDSRFSCVSAASDCMLVSVTASTRRSARAVRRERSGRLTSGKTLRPNVCRPGQQLTTAPRSAALNAVSGSGPQSGSVSVSKQKGRAAAKVSQRDCRQLRCDENPVWQTAHRQLGAQNRPHAAHTQLPSTQAGAW
jgi:hypothetical protein